MVTLKGTQAWIFFLTFFAATATIWSQGPVPRDFWKSYSIRPRYSTFKHFRACSACDEIRSTYAQCAIKFVPRMLSMYCTCKNCSHFTAGWVCAEIRSSYAQCAMKSFRVCSACDKIVPAKYQIKMQILTINNRNFQKPSRKPSNRTKVKISKKKIG